MDKEYLNKMRYDWTRDPRKLKVNMNGYMMVPDGRCFCCGRIFLNAEFNIAYCRDCDKAMSTNPLGPDHDFDTWGNKIKIKDVANSTDKEKKTLTIILTARREVRIPIDFDKEHEYFDRSKSKSKSKDDKPHFITAAGKIVPTEEPEEDAYSEALYRK
jgi:hypothetical protein